VVTPASVKYGPHRLFLNEQALIMYWRIHDLWGPTNLVASMIIELDDTPPYLIDDRRDSVGAIHGCPSRYHVEDLH
jgi:hypothetical protein